ncbi:hypothetical protein LTR37_015975 [Vermiconidia calcicola]|uniref:Uncharacterized protein n=1 Tax=Vermiconidia calcicola TaxID=1690605 RepID=A0ACC3MPA0_9PEZI|nr:hypothetical protein LTR37_015975 [Vermiconidia calcicola]
MCDFSGYGGPSEEWIAVEKSLPPAPKLTQEELKNATNKWREKAAEEEMETLSSTVSIEDHTIAARDGTSLEARSYRPSSVNASQSLPIYLHFHGGGFFFGTLRSEDSICSRIAVDVEVVVINVNYRHTPEHTYPTPWNDSEDTLGWILSHADEFGGDKTQIVVGGISAGAMLTAALMQTMQREHPDVISNNIKGQVLMVPPVLHEDCYDKYLQQLQDASVASYVENASAPILPLPRWRMFNELLYKAKPDFEDRRANPGNATPPEVAKLPPATFGICGLDLLRDEGILYAKLLQENGVPTNISLFEGVPHGFRRFGDRLSASKAWDKVMHEGIKWALSKPAPSADLDIHVY